MFSLENVIKTRKDDEVMKMTKISYKNLLPTVAGIVSYICNFIDLNPFDFEFFIAFYAIFPVIYVL